MLLIRARNFLKLLSLRIGQTMRKLVGKKIIHVIGDSHSLSFQDYCLKVHYLGPVTAYNLVNGDSSSGGRTKLFQIINLLKNGDCILLVFGEIDARIHIYNQYMKQNRKVSIEKIVDKVIANYSKVIKEILDKGVDVYVYNLVPPGPQDNFYNYPYYANWQTRLKITKLMNKKLNQMCKNLKIGFIDIFDQVVNPKQKSPLSFRRRKFVFDDVHLNEKTAKLVIDRFKNRELI